MINGTIDANVDDAGNLVAHMDATAEVPELVQRLSGPMLSLP